MTYRVAKQDGHLITQFAKHLEEDPSVEPMEIVNPWVVYYYRRPDWVDGRHMGTHNYGCIYQNAKGRYSLVGAAEEDWKEWKK